jgi:hypothetical protein
MSTETTFTESGSSPGKPQAPRGMPGASLVREAQYRTTRGALLAVREWWNKRRGSNAYRMVQATGSSGIVAEYTARRQGNAAIVFELYTNGIFDLSTPLAELPPLLGRELGRAWLKAESNHCGRLHIVGGQECSHNPSVHAGASELEPASRGEVA